MSDHKLNPDNEETITPLPSADDTESADKTEEATDQSEEAKDHSEEAKDQSEENVDNSKESEESIDTGKKKNAKRSFLPVLRIVCLIGFIIFTGLFINEVIIQPYRIKKAVDYTRNLYTAPTTAPTSIPSPTQAIEQEVTAAPTTAAITAAPTPDPNRDEQGRLLQFKDLLAENPDVKGWLIIPETNIDYVVMQSSAEDPDFYLHNDFNKEYSKAGTLYLDSRSSIEDNTQNLVIYGHNMVSTAEKMFHSLLNYKKVNYYKEHPLISFDTIYSTGTWKVFAVFITTPDTNKDYFFDYRKSTFRDASDFLNFVYQVRIRSLLNIDAVDIKEDDQLLMLSTCSYEVDKNYRTVVVARKVREGEDPTVDMEKVSKNTAPLYAEDYYKAKGGKAPEFTETFEEAIKNGEIHWYTTPENQIMTE